MWYEILFTVFLSVAKSDVRLFGFTHEVYLSYICHFLYVILGKIISISHVIHVVCYLGTHPPYTRAWSGGGH